MKLQPPKAYRFKVGDDPEFTGKLAPGGAFVVRKDGDIILHLWGVPKAAEYAEQVFATAGLDFFKSMHRALHKMLNSQNEKVRKTTRKVVRKPSLVHLTDGRKLKTTDRRLKEYRIWKASSNLNKGETMNSVILRVTKGEK